MHLLLAAASPPPDLWPFAVLLICVGVIIVLITVLRMHAYFALMLAAITAGMLSRIGSLPGEELGKSHWLQAVEVPMAEFGLMAGRIGFVIALAAVISFCLMESGAADKVVRRFLAVFGEKRAGAAIVASSYILSIPIFFDTFFMLLLPLARALRIRTGKDYLLYVLAICCAGTVTHSLIAPHPGPLAMAEALHVDLGASIALGLLGGILPVTAAWTVTKWLNRRMEIPMRETVGASYQDLKAIIDKPESELPSFFWSILPVLLPIFLISLASSFVAAGMQERAPALHTFVEFIGNRNSALLIGAAISAGVLLRQKHLSVSALGKMIAPSFETAGVIILITSAGGAFGLMLRNAGVGETIKQLADGREWNLVLLAWVVAAVIRVAQGSATVAMLTTAAMVYPIMSSGAGIPYHPVYIFMAIGFGAMFLSWMNDSGFWVVGKLSGFTEKETLKTWTVIVSVASVAGLIECLVFSQILPLR
jgi:gluconate:H+ symporter, GntP family